MGKITLAQAAAWCGGWVDPKYADVEFLGANNDSRNIQPGQLFLALQGVRDGHDFIPMAMDKGAAAVLCTHCDGDVPAIVVADVRIALGQIAAQERQRIGMKVVAVTGSVGKSTTKEMIATVLSTSYRVAKTPVNHNNDIGMPMAILAMPEDTEVAVLEMGMNHFREIAYLTNIGRPDVAVIINIGTMHIEHLGSREGILKAKLEILEGMTSEGQLLLYGNDDYLWSAQGSLPIKPVYFGTDVTRCSVLGQNVTLGASVDFQAVSGETTIPVHLELEGGHYVSDSLAAVSVGLALNVAPEKISAALKSFQNMEGRQEILAVKGYTIIKDCYNAGPESMAAALNVLGNRPGRKIAVLGDMLELGSCAPAEHAKIGALSANKADVILAYGPYSCEVVKGALAAGMAEENAKAFLDREELVAVLRKIAKAGDVMLFKGSHGMHMELALELFLKDE